MHFVCVVQNPTKRLTAKPTFSMDLLIHGSQLYSAILFKWSVYLPTPQLLYPPRAISGVSDPETGPAMCATTNLATPSLYMLVPSLSFLHTFSFKRPRTLAWNTLLSTPFLRVLCHLWLGLILFHLRLLFLHAVTWHGPAGNWFLSISESVGVYSWT